MMTSRNMKFQVWSQFAPKEVEGEKYVKGCIRNLIFEAAAHGMDDMKVLKTGYVKQGGEYVEQPVEWERYSFYTPEGLNIKHTKLLPLDKQPKDAPGTVYKKSGPEDTRTLKTNDPDKIAKLMFGPKVKGKDLMTWEGTWKAAHEANWAKKPDRWREFLDSLKGKIIGKLNDGMYVPPEMLEELGLTDYTPPPPKKGKKDVVKEGGHRFPDAMRINQPNTKSTMEDLKGKVKDFFQLSDDDFAFIGSTGKKLETGTSGDIDIAISRKALEEKFGITTP